MDSKLVAQLERLLSELADEGATRQRVEKIESLLLDNPELQDHYWSWMDIHVILGTDRAAMLGESKAASSPVRLRSAATTLNADHHAASPLQRRSRWWLGPALAVSACLLWILLPSGFLWRHIVSPFYPDLGDVGEVHTWRIPEITRVSWEGPYFAVRDSSGDSASDADVGLVSLGYVNGLPANGYVLRLEPGKSAELMMAADAYAENNLSVTELDANGTPVRRSVSFNNFGTGAVPSFGNVGIRTRRYGLIGTWSEFNDTGKPKYFLINGIHKSSDPDLPAPHTEQQFQLSEMVVTLDQPDLILLGWDDGGIEPTENSAGVKVDGDYDDISVLIRISGRGIDPVPSGDECRIVASTSTIPAAPQTDRAEQYQFTLQPGEIAVLKVASEAQKANALYLVREESGDVLWSAESAAPGTTNLGAVAVQNTSDREMGFAMFAENSLRSGGEEAEWQSSKLATIHTQPSCSILGFEDDGELGDFDDIRVTFLSLSPDRITPFDIPRRAPDTTTSHGSSR